MNHELTYKTNGTCSREIKIQIENDVVKSVDFVGGCPGNLAGISMLVSGMNIDEVIEKLEGIKCGSRSTSCPDQLTLALKSVKAEQHAEVCCAV